jgi:hypothetical protein
VRQEKEEEADDDAQPESPAGPAQRKCATADSGCERGQAQRPPLTQQPADQTQLAADLTHRPADQTQLAADLTQ